MKKWLLKLNIDKCTVISYGRHVTDYQYHMNHCGSAIALEKLSNIVDLGVNFDDKLSFKDHITDKTNKAYGVLGIIKRTFLIIFPQIATRQNVSKLAAFRRG